MPLPRLVLAGLQLLGTLTLLLRLVMVSGLTLITNSVVKLCIVFMAFFCLIGGIIVSKIGVKAALIVRIFSFVSSPGPLQLTYLRSLAPVISCNRNQLVIHHR